MVHIRAASNGELGTRNAEPYIYIYEIARNIEEYLGGTFSNAPIRKSHSQINVLIKLLHLFAETDRKKSQYLGHQLRKLEQT